jgi:hypothetical protein
VSAGRIAARTSQLAALAAALLAAASCSEVREPTERTPLRAPDLATLPSTPPGNPRAVQLVRWGDGSSFLAMLWSQGGLRAFEVSATDADTVEFRIEGCERLLDAVSEGGDRIALCEGDGSLRLHRSRRDADGWVFETVLDRSPTEPSERFHGLAVDGGRRAIFGPAALLWRTEADVAWQSVSLGAIEPSFRLETGGQVAITRDSVWLGYDHAEWSGALYRARIDAGRQLGPFEPVIERNVIGIEPAGDSGGVWVAGGLSHMTLYMAFLVRIQGSSLASIVAQDSLDSPAIRNALSNPSHRLPPDTHFTAFSLSPEGRPLVMDPERGIYEFSEDAFGMGTLRFAVEGMKSHCYLSTCRSYRDFVALPGGSFVLATNDGQVVVLSSHSQPRVVALP